MKKREIAGEEAAAELVELRRQVQQLKATEEKYRRLVEQSGVGLMLIDPAGNIREINSSFLELSGFDREEVINRNLVQILSQIKMDGKAALLSFKNVLVGQSPSRVEWTFINRKGREVTILCRYSIIREKGKIAGVTVSADEITERKRAELSLQESEKKYRTLVETLQEGLWVIDKDAHTTFVNRRMAEMLGYTPEEMLGRHLFSFMDEHGVEIARLQLERRRQGIGEDHDFEFLRKEGSRIYATLATSPIMDEKGTYLGAIAGAIDITPLKQSMEELKRHRQHLEEVVRERTADLRRKIEETERLNRGIINLLEDLNEANRRLEETSRRLKEVNAELEAYVYTVSHDLRAPLRSIQGFAQELLEERVLGKDESNRDSVEHISAAASRMDTLIDDLLTYSLMGRMEIDIKATNLEWTIRSLVADLKPRIQKSGAEVKVERPFPMVLGQHTILTQVIENLLINALTYVAPGARPQVRIWAEDKDSTVRLWVEDHGLGIAPEHFERIFRVFDRLHGIESYPGTGIGLAIVKRGMERLGGSVGLESGLGKGSKFWIELKKVD